jgi:hypothetical protein
MMNVEKQNEFLEKYRQVAARYYEEAASASFKRSDRTGVMLRKLHDELRHQKVDGLQILQTLLDDDDSRVRRIAATFALKYFPATAEPILRAAVEDVIGAERLISSMPLFKWEHDGRPVEPW